MEQKTAMKIMGITFVLIGIVFGAIGFMMLVMMGFLSDAVSAFSAFGAGSQLGPLNTILAVGWVFSAVTFLAGILSIVTAIAVFVSKE